jgi:predicted alpha/beta superfamily hydrolase
VTTSKSLIICNILPASLDSILKYCIPITLIILIASSVITAQDRHFTLKNTHYIQLKSELTNRDHELIVFLPDSYDDSPDKHYPVLYFLDAYWDMPLLNSIHGQLVWDNVIPELIMVGFSYPGEKANYGDLRARDFTPTRDTTVNLHSGDALKFLKFIETVVIPRIESDYRVNKNERALSGSSLGGFFTLYVMYEKPMLFKRFIAISPHVGWDNRYLFVSDDTYAAKNETLPVRLFLSQGSDEYAAFRDPIVEYQKKIAERNYLELALLNNTIEGERHSGVKSEGYSRGLRWVFKDIAPTGPSGLERMFQGRP